MYLGSTNYIIFAMRANTSLLQQPATIYHNHLPSDEQASVQTQVDLRQNLRTTHPTSRYLSGRLLLQRHNLYLGQLVASCPGLRQ